MSDSGLFGSFGAFFGGGGGKKQPQQQNFFDDLGFEDLAQQLKTNLPSQQAKYGSLTSGTATAEVEAVTKPSQEENNLEEDIALSEHDLQDGWGSIGSDDSNQQIGEINDKKDKMIEEIKEEDKGEILFPTKIVAKEKKEEQQNIKQLQAKQKQQQILQAQQQQQQLQQQQQQYARQASQKRAGRSSIKELDRIEEEGKLDQSGEDQTTESDVSSQHAKANNKKNNNSNSNSSNNNMNTTILQGLIPQKQQQPQQQAVYVPSTSVTAVSSSVKEQREHNNHHFNDKNTIQLYPKQEQDHQKQQDSQSQQQQQNHQQQRQKQRQSLEYRAQLIQPQSESSLSNLHLKQLLAMEDLISSEREELSALRIDQENKLQMWTEDLNKREGIISEQLKQRNLLDTKLHIKTSLLKDEQELRDLIETKGTLAEENQQLVKEVQLLKSTHQKQLQEIKLQNDKLQEKTQFLLHREQLMKTRLMNVLPKKGTLHKQLDELKDDVLDMMASVKNESNMQLSELSSRIKTEKNTMVKVQQQIIKLKTELQQKEYEIQKLQVKGGELAEDYKRSLQAKSKEYEEKVIGFNQQKNQLKMEFEEQLKKERETRYHLQLEEIADIRKNLQKDIDSHKEKEGIDERNRGEKVKQMKEKEQKIVEDRKKIEEEQEKNKIVGEENKKIKEKLEQLERNIGNEQLKLKEGQDRLMENTKKQEQQGEKLNEEMKKLNEQKKKLEGDVKRLDEDKKKVDMEKEEMKKEKMEVKKEKMEIKKQKMEIKKEKEEIDRILLDQRNKVREEYEESREKKERQEEQQQQYQQQQIVDWNVEKDDRSVEKKEEVEDEGEQIQNNDKMIQETINEEKDYQYKDESTDKWNTEGEEQVELSVGRARSSVAQSSSMKSAEKATENMVEEIEQQNGTTQDARDKDKSLSWEHMLANNSQLDPKEGFKLEGEKIIAKEIDVIPEISTEKVEKVKEIILTAQEPIVNQINKDIKPHKKDQTTSDDSFFFSLLNSKSEMNNQSQTQQSQQQTANPTVPEVNITPVGVVVTPTAGTSAVSKAKVGVKHLADDSLFSELLNDNTNNNNKSQIDSSVGTSSTKEKQQKTSVVPAPDDVFALLLSDQPISKKKPTKTKKGTKKTTEITNKNANIDFFAEEEVKKQQEQVISPPKATVNLNEKRETLLNEQNSENKEVIGFENIKNTDFADDLRQVSQTTPLKSDVKSPEKGVDQVKDNIEVINKNIQEESGNQEKIKLDEKIIEVSADKKIVNVSNDNKNKSKINFFEIPKVNENDIVWDFKLPTKPAATIVTASKEHTFIKEEIKPLEEMVKQENPFEIKNGLKIDSQQTAEIKETQKDIIETVKQSDILDILHPEATKTKKEKKKKPKNDNSNNNNNNNADDFFEQLLRKKKSERQEQEHQETNVSGWLSQDIIVGNDKQKAKKEEIKQQQQQEVAKNQLEVNGMKDQNKEQQQTINEDKVKDIEDNKDGWKETDIFDCVKEPEEIEKHENEDNKKKKEQEQIDELPIQDATLPVEISIEDKSNKISEIIHEQEDKSHKDQDKEEQKQSESDLIKSSNVSPKKEDNNINENIDAQPSQQLETNLNDKSIEKISPREEPSSPNQQQQSPEDNLESQLSQASENEDNQSGLYPNTDTDSGDVPLTFSQPQKKDKMKEQFLASLRQPKFQFNYFSNRQNLNKSPSRSPLRQSHHSNRSPQRQKQLQPQKIKQSLHASEDRLDSNQEFRNNAMSDPSMNQSASMASMSPQRKPMQQTFNISQDLHALDLSYQPHAGLDISAPQAMLDLSAQISNQQIHNNIQPSHNIDITSLDSRQMFMNLSGQYQGAMDLSGNHQIMDLSIGNQQAVMDLSASVKEGSLRVLGSKVDLSNQGSPTLIGGKWKQRGGPGNYNKRVHSGNNSICEENSINGGMNVLDLDSIEDFPDKRRKSSFHNRSLGLSNALSDHFITSSHHMIDLFIADQQKNNQNNQHNLPVSCQPKQQQQQQQQPNGSSSSPWESQNFIKLLSSKHKLSENLSDADMNTPVNNLNFQGNNQAVSGSDGNNNNKITILSTLMPRTISPQRQLRSPSEPRIQSTSPHRRLSADSRGSQKSKKQTKMSMFSCSDGQLPFQMQKQQQQEQELETSQTPIGSEMDAQMFTGIDQSPAYLGIQEREDSQKYQEDLLLGEEMNSQVLKGKIEENEKTCDGEIDKEEEIKEEKRESQIEERIDNEQRNLDGNEDGIEGVREINGDNNVNEEEMNFDKFDQEEKKDLGDQQESNEPQDLKEIEINEQQQIKEEEDDHKEPNIQTDIQEKTNNLCQPVSGNADQLDLDDGWGENQIKENQEENEIKEAEGNFMNIPQVENEELDDADNLKVSEKKEEINSNNNQLDLERAAEEALLQVDSEKEIDDKWGDTPLTTKQLFNTFPSRKTSKQIGAEEVVVEEQEEVQHGQKRKEETDSVGLVKEDKESGWEREEEVEIQEKDVVLKDEQDIQQESEKITDAAMLMNEVAVEEKNVPEMDEDLGLDNPWESSCVPDVDQVDETSQKSALPTDQLLFSNDQLKGEDKLNIQIDQEESHPQDSDNHDSTPGWTIQKPPKQLAAEQQKTQEQNDQPSIKPQIVAVNPFDMLRDSMIDDSCSSNVSLQKSFVVLEDPLSLFMQDGAQITSSKGSKKKKKKTIGENSSKPPAIAFEQISQFYVKAEPKNPFLPQKKETTSDADQGQDFFSGF